LLEHAIDPETSIAVIEQATTPFQRVFSTRLDQYEKIFGNRNYTSPTLIIIGKVASLHEAFRWLPENESGDELYFKPVTKNTEEEVRA
jgi:uroporphyrin-III C-methyltransferase/precorrin-2 dehydrogenase/sirohydrochlorin ferrochelatase